MFTMMECAKAIFPSSLAFLFSFSIWKLKISDVGRCFLKGFPLDASKRDENNLKLFIQRPAIFAEIKKLFKIIH